MSFVMQTCMHIQYILCDVQEASIPTCIKYIEADMMTDL